MKVTVFMIIVGIIFLCIFVGLLTLIVRALLKYIHSKDVRQEKSVVRKSLGEALKVHRTQCKMTQEFVAETIGVSRQAVSKWENGTSDPSTSNLFALAKLYGIRCSVSMFWNFSSISVNRNITIIFPAPIWVCQIFYIITYSQYNLIGNKSLIN